MSTPDRRGMLDPADERLSIRRQCELIGIARSGFYRTAVPTGDADLAVMKRLDALFTDAAVLRLASHDAAVASGGPCDQSQARPASDAADRDRGARPEAQHLEAGARAQDLPLPAARISGSSGRTMSGAPTSPTCRSAGASSISWP